MIDVANVRVSLDEAIAPANSGLLKATARALGISPADIAQVELTKRSVDARKKDDVHFTATLVVTCSNPKLEQKVLAGRTRLARGVKVGAPAKRVLPDIPDLSRDAAAHARLRGTRPVVVGFGPAGMFAALYLAHAGLKPLVIERGGDVDERLRAVERFNEGGPFDPLTNIQFGEGGAGTFSDGKLTTGTKSPFAAQVLAWFVEAGAPAEILWQAKPHIGTDKLVAVVRATRGRITELGGTVRFHAQLTGMQFEAGALAAIDVVDNRSGAHERIEANTLVLACGHSARDTFAMVRSAGLYMEQKPFSVGVRIEHPQRMINRAQYGRAADHPALGAADYKLVAHLPEGRSVYTFCMCPGGEVVCAASEPDSVVVNGMSAFARDGENANAAVLVGVATDDFPSDDPLAGVELQRTIERAAFETARAAGGEAYQAPAQTVGDFLARTSGTPSRNVKPTYARGVAWCNLDDCLPSFVADALRSALPLFGRKLRGFDDPDAVMTGVETRSSSPVRIVRDRQLRALFAVGAHEGASGDDVCAVAQGVYPCGEGPGYAGGIMSAACDGMRVAEAIVSRMTRATLSEVARALQEGKPAIFPTDTVVGLGVAVCALDDPAVLYELKDRPRTKPIAWLVAGPDVLERYAHDVPAYAHALARAFWPGALTLIVKASAAVSPAYASETGTIGLRMPASATACALIEAVGCPLATTSANAAGDAAPRTTQEVDAALMQRVGIILHDDGTEPQSGVASTIVDCTQATPRIVRAGSITAEDIERVLAR